MLDRHPSRYLLTRYVKEQVPLPQRRRIGKHVSVCDFCQRRERELTLEESAGFPRVDYEPAIQRAARGAMEWLGRFNEDAPQAALLLNALLEEPPSRRPERIRELPQGLALKLLRLLQDRCHALWPQEPVRAVELAQLAVAVSEGLDEARCGSGLVADSRALAWADLGNSYRILSDFGKAEQALRIAAEHQKLSGDPLTESEILSVLASLRRAQGRGGTSFAFYDRIIEIAREGEDRHREGRAMIAKGTALAESSLRGTGSSRDAIRLLRKGTARIDPSAEPQLLLAARHNIFFLLAEIGRAEEARQLLDRERHLYRDLGKETHLAGLHWLEGLIADGLGQLPEAEAALRVAKERISQQQNLLDSTFVSLRLSLVLCKRGQRCEPRRLLEEVIPVLKSLGTYPESAAARLLYLRLHS